MHTPNLHAFIGTYTVGTESKGIYALHFNTVANNTPKLRCVISQKNPSYLCINYSTKTLYAVEESFGSTGEEGGIWSYRIHDNGNALEALNKIGSLGVGPCFLSLDQQKQTIFTANYHSGSVTASRLLHNGSLGPVTSHIQLTGSSVHPERQRSSHPHAILVLPDNRHIVVADLGTDQLKVFNFDAKNGTLSTAPAFTLSFPPGFGPRHLALHPKRPFLYVIHEIASTVTTHRLDGADIISPPLQTLPVRPPHSTSIADAADIVIDEVNSLLYASTRKTDSLYRFSINPASGLLTSLDTFPSGGKSPHAIAVTPSGAFLCVANIQTNNVEIFRKKRNEIPQPIGRGQIPSPSAIVFS